MSVPGRDPSSGVDLYSGHYGNHENEIYRAIRVETWGEDLGQASWITADECRCFLEMLQLGGDSQVLDVGCGSGGISMFISRESGVRVTGIDANENGIRAAQAPAAASQCPQGLEFLALDAAEPLPFAAQSFDAVFCNDSINHLPDRASVLAEWYRVLRPGGRLLYTDPVILSGQIDSRDMAARSSIGYFVFTAPGVNEALLEQAGFREVGVHDVTTNMAVTAARWHRARRRRREMLTRIEGAEQFDGLQRFLDTVRRLAEQRCLVRVAFLARK